MIKEVTESVVATVEVPTEEIKEKVIQQEVGLVEIRAKEMAISTDAEYEVAADFGRQIKEKAKIITDFFKPMKESAHRAHKAVCDREKTMLNPLWNAEKMLKKSMIAYLQEKEHKRIELEYKLQREAEAERDKILNEAVLLEVDGKTEEAEAVLMDAQLTESVSNQVVVVMDIPKMKGVSSEKDWEIEEIDEEVVPVNFGGVEIRPVDEKVVMRLIRASKGNIQVPGIKYKEIMKMSIRR